MKKLLFLLMLSLFSFGIVYADNIELQYDNEIHIYGGPNVNLILNDEVFVPSEGQMPPIIIQNRTLVPVREVFEKLDGVVTWDATDRKIEVKLDDKNIVLWLDKTTAVVNGENVELDVPAKLINAKTMVPVRFISENGGLNVEWDGDTSTVTVSKAKAESNLININSVMFSKVNNEDCIIVEMDEKASYHVFDLKPEEDKQQRIILDIDNSKFNFGNDTIYLDNDSKISKIRFGVQENNVNRIVLDMNSQSEYTVFQSEDGKAIYIVFVKDFNLEQTSSLSENNEANSNIDSSSEVQGENNDNTLENGPADNQEDISENNIEPEEIVEKAEISSRITSIKYSTASDKLRIILDKKFEYELTELEEPKRIVLHFTESALDLNGPDELTLKNKAISTVKAEELEDGSASITVTMSKNSSYELSKKTSELQIKVEEPSYTDVEYNNKGTYSELILRDVSLSALTKLQSKNTKKYTIKYSSIKFNPGSGAIEVNDEFVKKISVTSTKITITDTGNMKYKAVQNGNDVIFTIEKDDVENEKIIILDAGHGGSDPGASNGDSQEKTYNLKVLLKLKDLLENSGYTVYTTRESDVTLSVNDRVYIATKDYPNALLYVSIHHNSLNNKNYSGTLVMYCDRDTSAYGVTNKKFATYVLNELVDKLDTVDRGFIEVKQDDTSKRVLTEVPMPSILCELAFISNDDELERIKTNKFQNLAAEAIYNGIVKTLSEMKEV